MPTPNYNFDVQTADIARRQKIADALSSGQLVPMQNLSQLPGGVAGGAMAFAAPIIQALLGKRMQENLKTERSDLTQRYESGLSEGMQNYYSTYNGDTEHGVKGDPRKAIANAIASNHPALREFAMKQAAEWSKGQLTPKDLAGYANPQDVVSSPNDPSKWTGKRDIKDSGGILYDGNTAKVVTLEGPQPTFPVINGDRYQKSPSTGAEKKLDNAPKVTVGVHPTVVNAGQKAGMQEYFKNAATQVGDLGKIATQAQNNKQSIAELRSLDSNGIFSNVQTGPATFLSNLGQGLGIQVDTSKLGNTEAYNALTTELWQGLVSKYGGNRGVTQQEAAEIKKMLPQAASSPQARQQLFNILDRAADRQIAQYQSANAAFAEASKADDPTIFSQKFQGVYTPTPNQPAPVTQPKSKQPTVSNW
jgi:hypothetical protein